MKNWRRPTFAFFALLAMLLPLLPQVAWSCPMTGRVGSALFVCKTPKAVAAAAKPNAHACCKKQPQRMAPVAKGTHVGCTNPGGPCCKLVRLPGRLHTATNSNTSFVAPLQNLAPAVEIGPAIAVLPAISGNAPLLFVRAGYPPTQKSLATQHIASRLSGRAPPTS